MANVVKTIGYGGQRFAEIFLGWNRKTIRKGQLELENGNDFPDRFQDRGRHKAEEHHPHLLENIRAIIEPSGQTDPTFRSTRIYTPLTAKEVRKRLVEGFGYCEKSFPCERTINNKLNQLNFSLKKVKKCLPKKKIPETDAIFEGVKEINEKADKEDGVLRISLDSKAAVKVGKFSRGGKSRQEQKALDHDFQPEAILIPFGVLLPATGESHLWFGANKVTADFMVDRLEEILPLWRQNQKIEKLVINADNGPESNGHRTQWLKRLVEFSDAHQVSIELAYYPPYHSKYNPVERLWGILENHWKGEILETVDKTVGLARSMTYKGIKPTVRKVTKVYRSGVSLTKRAMKSIEARLERKKGLEWWSINISPMTGPSTGLG